VELRLLASADLDSHILLTIVCWRAMDSSCRQSTAARFADQANNGGSTMSDNGMMATGAPDEWRDAGPKLPCASGDPEPDRSLADFVKQQPLTAALLAVGIGYLLGKVT
jgi:hypothetical protein